MKNIKNEHEKQIEEIKNQTSIFKNICEDNDQEFKDKLEIEETLAKLLMDI